MSGGEERPEGRDAHRRERTTVVIASHGRLLRLRWLLNALEEQTLAAGRFDVVVVHTYPAEEEEEMIASHPLHTSGRLRAIRLDAGEGRASRQRNLGWRAATSGRIAFTDDDCRPASGWLAGLVAAAERAPGAVVQGATFPDPDEEDVRRAPHVRTVVEADPPGRFAQTCNILYPRDVLERVGGFDETMPAPAGEDTDLWLRARAAGATMTGAPDAVVFHAIEDHTLPAMLRLNWKWRHLAFVVARHPEVRGWFRLRVFWRERHARLALALLALAATRRVPPLALGVAPYLHSLRRRRRPGPRGLAISAVELPGQVVVDLGEVAALAAGSIRYRTVVL
jgi:GT2 family glycosyltransferase